MTRAVQYSRTCHQACSWGYMGEFKQRVTKHIIDDHVGTQKSSRYLFV